MGRVHVKAQFRAEQKEVPYTSEEETDRDEVEAAAAALAPKYAAIGKINKLETIQRRIRENLIALGTKDQVVIDEEAAIAIERDKL